MGIGAQAEVEGELRQPGRGSHGGLSGASGQPAAPAAPRPAVRAPGVQERPQAVHAGASARALFESGGGQGRREGASGTARAKVAQEGNLQRSMVFDIFGVVTHSGNLESGHYVSYARVAGRWFKFDDAWVTAVDEEDVKRTEAYMLFYAEREL